eukprot:2839152-Ditylum_brightwellii.AAC.1
MGGGWKFAGWGRRRRRMIILERASDPFLELALHLPIVELAAIDEGGMAFSLSEVSSSTMRVSSPSP